MIAVLGLLLLGSCSKGNSHNPKPHFGTWRAASAEAAERGEKDEFWWRLTSSGRRILAMTSLGDIWISDAYSSGWKTLPWLQPGTPYSWYAESDTLWVGTENPGHVYACRISSWNCSDLHLPVSRTDSLQVAAITRLHGDIKTFSVNHGVRWVHSLHSGTWGDWSEGYPKDVPFRCVPSGDTLWTAGWEQGTWYRTSTGSTWQHLPAPRATWRSVPDSVKNPRGLALHEGALWIGDWTGEITRVPLGGGSYQAFNNCPANVALPNCRNKPLNNFSLLSYNGQLFAGGFFGSAPYVLDPGTGYWITTEDAGWCWNDGKTCGGTRTWDMIGLGDTLYSASSRFIMKIALKDVPVFDTTMMNKYFWRRDTTWRDSALRSRNPIGN